MPDPSSSFSNRDKNFCEYGGIFGVLLSLTCLIQHIAVAIPGKVTNPMIPGYLFAIAAFALMGMQKTYAVILLIISGANAAFTEYQWMKHYSFSLVVLLLFIYHIIIIVAMYAEQIPERLKQKKLAEQAEEEKWRGKI